MIKNNIPDEKAYQRAIIDYLVANNGYRERKNANYDRLFAMDREMLFTFLEATQPEKMESLRNIFGEDMEETLVQIINRECTSAERGLLYCLKKGVDIQANLHIDLMYSRPATEFNQEELERYNQNLFSVAEEVWISDKERIDLVVFLNGLAIISFELKSNTKGQTYEDAIYQYRTQRDSKNRLFLFNAGCLVNFAMDLLEVHMTTKLEGEKTFFLPFNMGSGEGINTGKGNPLYEDEDSVSYMWEEILTKDSLLELINEFMFVEKKYPLDENGREDYKKKPKVSLIFPRFHQRDAIHRILDDVTVNGTSQNYLIQHSAGSGKTKTIAWLAHRLSSLHNEEEKQIYDTVVIITDRVVVDSQLQKAVMQLEHVSGLIKVMDDNCTSTDLARALESKTKIVATTIQKFPFALQKLKEHKQKTYALIIDEAHSSTSGKDMAATMQALTTKTIDEEASAEDVIAHEIATQGKQDNVSVFAFTATPKSTTLKLFGKSNKHGKPEAFHIYSMKQAIEEGFILDVLQNYTTYKTFYKLNKEIAEDPRCKTNDAKRQIARFVDLHETNISQRVEVIVEHFRQFVMAELGGTAKAMVVTTYKETAYNYHKSIKEYIQSKGYRNMDALVAFSGKVKLEDGTEYTEVGVNEFKEDRLPLEFEKDDYQVLIVAGKYQTGFDQPKLCAMYLLKNLSGVSAVQALSRLNRICPPYDKKTFILDFTNSYDEVVKAFSKYYTTTVLSNNITPGQIYDLEAKLDGFYILDPMDIDRVAILMKKPSITTKEEKEINFCLGKAKKTAESKSEEMQGEFKQTMRHFVRFYEFLIQATCHEDIELHKKYLFVGALLDFMGKSHSGRGYDLKGKIKAVNFVQKKDKEYIKTTLTSSPVVKLPNAEDFHLAEDKVQKLSEIIADINSRTGKDYDKDVVVKAMLQIKDLLLKSEKLKVSAQNNTPQDFNYAFYDNIDEALMDGLEQNQDFFSLLLNNKEMKERVLGIFSDEVYHTLRKDNV